MPPNSTRSLPERRKRILVGCFRGMGDLLYVSSILGKIRKDLPEDIGIDLAAGRGLWAEAVRHVPYADRIVPIDSWDAIPDLGRNGYERVLTARVSAWMPFSVYRGWSLRARWSGLHLIDVLARTLGVDHLEPEYRGPAWFSDPADPEDDPGEAIERGRYAVVALHGFTNFRYNRIAAERLLKPLLAEARKNRLPLVLTGPPPEGDEGGRSDSAAGDSILDLRGAPIRRVATFVRHAHLVVSVLNGITVLADALRKPLVLLVLGPDPLPVVGPLLTRPIATLGRAGSWRDLPVDPGKFLEAVRHGLEREQAIPENR